MPVRIINLLQGAGWCCSSFDGWLAEAELAIYHMEQVILQVFLVTCYSIKAIECHCLCMEGILDVSQ